MAEAKLDTQIRREQIIQAAINLVTTQGLRRLNIAAVARRVGLVPSGIYRHFKSKDEIVAAVLERIEQRLMANVREAREETDVPVEQLKGVLMRHIRLLREGNILFIPRIIFSDDMHAGNPERKQRVLQILMHYTGEIGEIVCQGQARGSIRPDLDPQTITMMLFGIVLPAGILWHLTDGGFDVTRHAKRAWQMFSASVINNANNPVSEHCEQ